MITNTNQSQEKTTSKQSSVKFQTPDNNQVNKHNPEILKILEGCGKEYYMNVSNQIWICRSLPPKVFIEDAQPLTKEGINKICSNPAEYFFELCPSCKSILRGILIAQEKEVEFLEEHKSYGVCGVDERLLSLKISNENLREVLNG